MVPGAGMTRRIHVPVDDSVVFLSCTCTLGGGVVVEGAGREGKMRAAVGITFGGGCGRCGHWLNVNSVAPGLAQGVTQVDQGEGKARSWSLTTNEAESARITGTRSTTARFQRRSAARDSCIPSEGSWNATKRMAGGVVLRDVRTAKWRWMELEAGSWQLAADDVYDAGRCVPLEHGARHGTARRWSGVVVVVSGVASSRCCCSWWCLCHL